MSLTTFEDGEYWIATGKLRTFTRRIVTPVLGQENVSMTMHTLTLQQEFIGATSHKTKWVDVPAVNEWEL